MLKSEYVLLMELLVVYASDCPEGLLLNLDRRFGAGADKPFG